MKKLIILILFITLISCDNNKESINPKIIKSINTRLLEENNYNYLEIINIDSCQYIRQSSKNIRGTDIILHKADCNNKIHKLNKK